MVWKKVVFKQIQPIHIGVGSYGVINDTNVFIPGWTMWGALTKAYSLANGWLPSRKQLQPVSEGKPTFEKISCFYPSSDEEGKNVLFPWIDSEGVLNLGDYSETEFRAKFVDTFTSTAVVPVSRSAKEESLHEVNVILLGKKQGFRDDQNKSLNKGLFWAGIVNVGSKKSEESFLTKGTQIFVGGDLRYGLGLMEIVYCEDLSEELPKSWLIYDKPGNADGGKFLVNYLSLSSVYNKSGGNLSIKITGSVKRIVHIENSWSGYALRVSKPADGGSKAEQVFYLPGSKVEEDNTAPVEQLSLIKGKLVKEK